MYEDRTILTDESTIYSRQDIVIVGRKGKNAHLAEVSIPNDKNIAGKYAEKIIKYIPY